MARLHFDAGFDDEKTGAHRTACGRVWQAASVVTLDRADVTCRSCARRLRARSVPPPPPFVPGPPVPSPPRQVWDGRGRGIVQRSIKGDDGADREQWPTVDHALRDWFAVRCASLLGSSTRFGESSGQRGDRTPVAVARVVRVLPVDRAVARACHGGIRFDGGADGAGSLELSARACQSVVEHVQLGRSMADASERVSSAFRVVLTERQARSVWTRIRGAIGERLHAAGLLGASPKRERAQREGASMAKPPGYDLDGWKEIASHLGCGETTAKRWAQRGSDPLPTAEYNGSRVASKARLDAWRARQVRESAA